MDSAPVHVAAAPLLSGPVGEVPDVEVAGLVAERWRGPAGRRVLIVECQNGHRHASPPSTGVADIISGPGLHGSGSARRARVIRRHRRPSAPSGDKELAVRRFAGCHIAAPPYREAALTATSVSSTRGPDRGRCPARGDIGRARYPGPGVSISGHWRAARRAVPRGMAWAEPVYRPRDAEHTVLHQVVAEHLDAFLRAAVEAGDGVVSASRSSSSGSSGSS
jgi:hypothetical protein